MGTLKLNNKDFEEISFNMKPLRDFSCNNRPQFQSSFGLCKSTVGDYQLKIQKKGSIYFAKTNCYFYKNILSKTSNVFSNITLYFIKKGFGIYDFSTNSKIHPNTHNVLFMHEDYKSNEGCSKEQLIETTSLHLPPHYFEHLVGIYPDIFEDEFLRYKKGESFCLNTCYKPTSMQVYYILSQLENSYLLGNCNEIYTDAKVLELLSILFNKDEKKLRKRYCKTTSDCNKIHEAAHILTLDIHRPPSVKDLSLKVGLNEKKLKYGFKEVFDTTVYGYLFEYKMLLAQQLLVDTEKPISEIAFIVGYDYLSHFSTAFRRRFGIPPKNMRDN